MTASTKPSDDLIKALAQLDAAISFCRQLGETKFVSIELSDENTNKAIWLERSGRPFFQYTPHLQERVQAAMQKAAIDVFESGEGTASVAEIFFAGTEAVRAVVNERFALQGGDVTLEQNTPSWTEFKMRHGFSTLIGVYKKQLSGAIPRARITFR